MKRLAVCLSLMLLWLCVSPAGAEAPARAFGVTEPPVWTEEEAVTVQVFAEAGVEYTLSQRNGNIWQYPENLSFAEAGGEVPLTLGPGANEFVLREAGVPREDPGNVWFTIFRGTEEEFTAYVATLSPEQVAAMGLSTPAPATPLPATQAPTPTTTPTPTPSPTPAPTPAPTPTPTPTPEPTPTPTPTPSPTPTPTPSPTPEPTPEPTPTPSPTPIPSEDGTARVLRLWKRGNDVFALQDALSALSLYAGNVDGVYGPRTRAAVRALQRAAEIREDGVVGPETRAALSQRGFTLPVYAEPDKVLPEGFSRALSLNDRGEDVTRLQELLIEADCLSGEADGVYGAKTAAAVRRFQRRNRLLATGTAGGDTLAALLAP